MTNLPSCAHVHYKTLNLVFSRCCFTEDDEEMYQNSLNTAARRSSIPGGNSHMKGAGMLVENFELNP